MVNSELCPTDTKFLSYISKIGNYFLLNKGVNNKKQIKLTLDQYQYYKTVIYYQHMIGKPNFIHECDRFLHEFNRFYQDNEEYQEVILCSILYGCVAKMSENLNPKIDINTLNF